jgi:hypothetical protein
MTTALQIVRGALLKLRVTDASSATDEQQLKDGIDALNRMVRTWEAFEQTVGWSDVDDGEDVLNTPPELDDALIYNLAVRLCDEYGVEPTQAVMGLSLEGLALISAMVASATYVRTEYQDLPRGEQQLPGYGWRAGLYR